VGFPWGVSDLAIAPSAPTLWIRAAPIVRAETVRVPHPVQSRRSGERPRPPRL